MTTTTVTSFQQRLSAGHVPFWLRRVHSLTGILFGGYIIIHLLVNATLIEGFREGGSETVFQQQVGKIHSIPFLLATEWLLIYLPIIYHTVYGFWLTFSANPNPSQYPYSKNLFYLFQRLTAILLAALILFHVTAMKGWYAASLRFDPVRASQTVVSHMGASWFIAWFIYPLFILCASYHLANGFWTAAITWGLTITKTSQKQWGYVCAVLFAVTFVCGMTALIAALGPAALARHG